MNLRKITFGLGSNMGDRAVFIDRAIELMVEKLSLVGVRRSRIIENKAMLPKDAPQEWDMDFFNLVVEGEVDLDRFEPVRVLEIIKGIEFEIGRRDKKRWAPREIDIDILLIEDLQIDIAGKLVVPHYDLNNRDFFMRGIEELQEVRG